MIIQNTIIVAFSLKAISETLAWNKFFFHIVSDLLMQMKMLGDKLSWPKNCEYKEWVWKIPSANLTPGLGETGKPQMENCNQASEKGTWEWEKSQWKQYEGISSP